MTIDSLMESINNFSSQSSLLEARRMLAEAIEASLPDKRIKWPGGDKSNLKKLAGRYKVEFQVNIDDPTWEPETLPIEKNPSDAAVRTYAVEFHGVPGFGNPSQQNKRFDISFTADGSFGFRDAGKAKNLVFGTILYIIRTFRDLHPGLEEFEFSAHGPQRVKLYNVLAKRLGKGFFDVDARLYHYQRRTYKSGRVGTKKVPHQGLWKLKKLKPSTQTDRKPWTGIKDLKGSTPLLIFVGEMVGAVVYAFPDMKEPEWRNLKQMQERARQKVMRLRKKGEDVPLKAVRLVRAKSINNSLARLKKAGFIEMPPKYYYEMSITGAKEKIKDFMQAI